MSNAYQTPKFASLELVQDRHFEQYVSEPLRRVTAKSRLLCSTALTPPGVRAAR